MKSAKRVGIAASSTVIAILGLWNQPAAAQDKTQLPAFLYADAFSDSLRAVAGQTIVFESNSAGSVARIELPEGRHRLCMDSSGEYFSGIVLDDATPVLDSQGCTAVNGRSGFYRVRLSHAAGEPALPEVALLSIDRPGAPLVASTGEVRKGYWALTQWIDSSRTEETTGRLQAVPSNNGRMPVVGDLTSSRMDLYSLWQFGTHSPALMADPLSAFHFDRSAISDSAKGTIFVGHDGEAAILGVRGDATRFQLRLENSGAPSGELQ